MFTCPQCGYDKNEEEALCCNLCGKVFKKETGEDVTDTSALAKVEQPRSSGQVGGEKVITSINDLAPELKNKLQKEKTAILSKMDDSLSEEEMKKGCLFIGMALLGVFALIVLYFMLKNTLGH